jgi:uncharacterized membrane protein (UPF0127 family)
MKARLYQIPFFLCLWLVAIGCDQTPQDVTVTLPTTTIHVGNRDFTMEKATTIGQQERGLMRRDSLADDHGMIFIFPSESPQEFWNHNVRFPLDVVFLNGQEQVVSIQHMKPYDDTTTQSVQAQYVIELNDGTAEKIGLKVGDKVNLPADAVAH